MRNPFKTNSYTAKDIEVLEGLDPVRRRPSMYIGSTDKEGVHHLLWEIIDNAIDEVISGFADEIIVRLYESGDRVEVEDNGRGIPVDLHPKYKKSALELVMTTLHAGGKFGNKSYIRSGGIHGVGASVVNALSEYMLVEVYRDGKVYYQEYSRGKPKTKVKIKGETTKTGTKVVFSPDPTIFFYTKFDPNYIKEVLEEKSFLHKRLKIKYYDEINKREYVFCQEEGIIGLLKQIGEREGVELITPPFYTTFETDSLLVETTFTWTNYQKETFFSYVNGIRTKYGGTHENALKLTIVKAVKNYITWRDLKFKGINITGEDIREGVIGVISVFMHEPQFQGQTKERLNSPEVIPAIEGNLRTLFEKWLMEHEDITNKIIERIIISAKSRIAAKLSTEKVRSRTVTHRLNLPGKLADCASTDPTKSELFIVEGESAGGSAKQARDRLTQAVLPLRGKVLNVQNVSLDKLLKNKELSDIADALGCGIGERFREDKLRYHKVILLMDADSDGNHITTLLLTFFYKYMPELIKKGYVYIAQPPLYKIEVGKEVYWAKDDKEKEEILKKLGSKKSSNIKVQRFKGLGEMMPQVLKETTISPKSRTLLRVVIDDEIKTSDTFETLMGKDPGLRFKFVMEHATEVEELDN